jgi:hypothetical protein
VAQPFFINIPIGLAALALSPVLLRESLAALTRRSYDPAGALTITGALVLLVYAVVEAPHAGWGDVRTILPLAGSVLLLAAFTLIESRHHAPLVPLRILRSRSGPRPARSPVRPRSARPDSARPPRQAWRSSARGRSCSRRSPHPAATSASGTPGGAATRRSEPPGSEALDRRR